MPWPWFASTTCTNGAASSPDRRESVGEARSLARGFNAMLSRSARRPSSSLIALALSFAIVASACTSDDPESTFASSELPTSGDDPVGTATRPLSLTDPGETPTLDRAIASVPLDEIIFDTFDGGSTPLSEADPATVDRLFDAIRPIDAPAYEVAADADWLSPADIVVGFVDPRGGSWAYPTRILNSREIVNDELGGMPVVITFCPLCGSGVVYGRELDGQALSFSNSSALFENDMVMVDRETGSYWWQVAGDALVGELTGSTLELLPSQTTTLERWLEQYPDSWVIERPDGRINPVDAFAGYGARLDRGQTPFPVSDEAFADDRLDPSDRVIVVELGGERRAWATAPARSVTDELGGQTITVTLDGVGGVAVDEAGSALPLRSAFWFSVVSVEPGIELGS